MMMLLKKQLRSSACVRASLLPPVAPRYAFSSDPKPLPPTEELDPLYTLEELKNKVDMTALQQFNPKLHSQVKQNPELLLEL